VAGWIRAGAPAARNTHAGWRHIRRLIGGTAVFSLIAIGTTFLVSSVSSLGDLGQGGLPLISRFIGAIVLIIAVGWVGGWVAVRLGQPRVIGEMAAGIALGPSLLGQFAPNAEHWLFPAKLLPHLNLVSQFAVISFVFLFGADLSLGLLTGSRRRVAALGVGMVALPVGCGVLLAAALASHYRPAGVLPISFLLFVGVSIGVTAFPVLVRILTELGLDKSPVGVLALAAAGIDDAIAWCLLAVATATVNDGSLGEAVRTITFFVIFAVLTWTVLRPALRQFVAVAERYAQSYPSSRLLSAALLLLFALCGAFITDKIGVHAIFGAFLIGLSLPRNSSLVRDLTRTIERGVRVVLPLFFAVVGLKVHLDLLSGRRDLLVAGLILLVAIGTKLGGTTLIGRLTGLPWRESFGLGTMVNCRGLTELVVLTTGLSLGIIGPDLFVMLVLMTLVTTTMTSPLLKRLRLNRDPWTPDPVGDSESDGDRGRRWRVPAITPG
jgi:Kef-type K+ transport system membrane component KefB